MTKKIVALLLALLLVFSFAACGSEETPDSIDTSDEVVLVVDTVTPDEGESVQTENAEKTEPAPEVEIPVEEDTPLPEDENSEAVEEELPPAEEPEAQDTPVPDAIEDKQPVEGEKSDTSVSDNSGESAAPQQPVHQHSYFESVMPATCTTKGYTTYTCECGHSYTANYNGGGGHKYEEVYSNEPVYETVCITRCGYCHVALKDVGVDHIEEEALAGNGGSSYQSYEQVLIGYEDQLVGYACSICGAER